MNEELRDHLERQVAANIASGMPPAEARRQAFLQLGALEGVRESCREQRRGFWLETLLADIRHGIRRMLRSPGFTIVATLTLALGIGANTSVFSVVQAVLLAPLPYNQPDRLVMVWENNPHYPRVWISYPNFQDWQHRALSFQQMAAFLEVGTDLTAPGSPEHVNEKQITSGLFGTLGAGLALGREFSPDEDRHGGRPVAIISNQLWKNRFDGNPDALGKSVTLDGVDFSIVGVAPPGFRLMADADVYTPLGRGDQVILDDRGSHDGIYCLARLGPGVRLSQAQAEMNAIQSGLDHLYPDANRDLGIYVEPLKQVIVQDTGETLVLLLGAVGLVLLIACANFASLLLVHSTARYREFAIRTALGATAPRIARQFVTESVLLSLVGGTLGLALAKWTLKLALSAIPLDLPRAENISVNTHVLLFALVVSLVVGIFFGLAPALKCSTADPQDALKEGGRGSTSAPHYAQNALVIAQMALTLVLLVAAGLLFRTIRRLWDINPGFDTHHLIAFKVGVSPSLRKTPSDIRLAYQQLTDRIRKIPGVEAADLTRAVPLTGLVGSLPFWINSQKPVSVQGAPRVAMYVTGPDYLRTMGISLLRGRFFTLEDAANSPCVVAIDAVLARMYFPNSDPLGQTISAGFSAVGPCRIVGVVGHVQDGQLGDSSSNSQAEAYFPLYQLPEEWVPLEFPNTTLVVRTSPDLSTILPTIKGSIHNAGGDQPIFDLKTMQQVEAESMSSERFPMTLLAAAGVAMLLAAVGIYGVISYGVAQRVHEIGIRMALGAKNWEVFRLVIGQGLRLALLGIAIGGAGALALARLVSSYSRLLYGVRSTDPVTFIAVSVLLAVVAILACYVPARRAMRVDPMTALRYE
jgi:predicted permease